MKTPQDQVREGGGGFSAIHRVCEHYILETTIWSDNVTDSLPSTQHLRKQRGMAYSFSTSFTKGADTPHSSPSLMGGLLSAATATGVELETDLKGPLTATSKPLDVLPWIDSINEGNFQGGGLRVQGLAAQRRKV